MFVAIPTLFTVYTGLQIETLIFMQQMYVVYYFQVEPYIERVNMRLVVFNEVMVMLFCYHLFLFTKAVDYSLNHFVGYSFAINIGLLTAVNMAVMLWKVTERYKRKKRMETA